VAIEDCVDRAASRPLEHRLSAALEIADRLMILERGRLVVEIDRASADTSQLAGYLSV
jgi:ABC-type branched-subunit amino acid transport system ATPase component